MKRDLGTPASLLGDPGGAHDPITAILLDDDHLTCINISSQFFSPYSSPIILVVPALNIFTKFRRGHPLRGADYRLGRKILDFLPISRYISQTIQNIAMVTMEGEQELVCDLSNGAISSDLERTLTPFSKSHHSLTLNISQTATDTTIVSIEGEQETALKLPMSPTSMTLSDL